jgi:hypothetical protein
MRNCCVSAGMFRGLKINAKTRLRQTHGDPVQQWFSDANARMPAVSDQPFNTNVSPRAAGIDPLLEHKFSTAHIVYLAAIAAGTAGWLWLLARILIWSIPL